MKHLADVKHAYTLSGGSRPYGVSLMYGGYDSVLGFQLYCSDPSGNYAAWRANATGKNSASARSTLKEEYEQGCSIEDGLNLAIKVLTKSIDLQKPEANRYEIAVVTKDADGKVVQNKIEGAEL